MLIFTPEFFHILHSIYISLKALEIGCVYESLFIAEDGGC